MPDTRHIGPQHVKVEVQKRPDEKRTFLDYDIFTIDVQPYKSGASHRRHRRESSKESVRFIVLLIPQTTIFLRFNARRTSARVPLSSCSTRTFSISSRRTESHWWKVRKESH